MYGSVFLESINNEVPSNAAYAPNVSQLVKSSTTVKIMIVFL
jgi:hypothetical protein